MSSGYVYCLTNPIYGRNIIKIGKTKNPVTHRMFALQSCGVPAPFECVFAIKVQNYHEVEKELHEFFSEYRVNKVNNYKKRREFFYRTPEEVIKMYKFTSKVFKGDFIEDIDEYEQENTNEEKETKEEINEEEKIYRTERAKEYHSKNLIRIRTNDNLVELLNAQETGNWNINRSRLRKNVKYIEIFNFEGTEKITGVVNHEKTRYVDETNKRSIISFTKGRKEQCNPKIDWYKEVGMSCVNYSKNR